MILVLRINLHYKYTFVTRRYFDETADPIHKCLSLVVTVAAVLSAGVVVNFEKFFRSK